MTKNNPVHQAAAAQFAPAPASAPGQAASSSGAARSASPSAAVRALLEYNATMANHMQSYRPNAQPVDPNPNRFPAASIDISALLNGGFNPVATQALAHAMVPVPIAAAPVQVTTQATSGNRGRDDMVLLEGHSGGETDLQRVGHDVGVEDHLPGIAEEGGGLVGAPLEGLL